MSAIEKYVPEDTEIDRIQRIATNFANSGYFEDAKEALQAFVKISAGAEMGLQPFVSMSGISIIKGKPVVGAGILAGLLDAHPEYDYSVAWAPNSTEPTSCTVTVYKNGVERGQSSFSYEDAKRANLTNPSRNGEPSMYTKYPRNMLYARAMSNAVAWYAPSVTNSNGRVFVDGELDDVDARPEPAPRRKREATPAPEPSLPRETVIEAEVVPDAPVAGTTAESVAPDADESASGTANPSDDQIKACSAMLKSIDDAPRAAIKAALQRLGLGGTLTVGKIAQQLVVMFGPEAAILDHVLVGLNERVQNLSDPHAPIKGEIPADGDEEAAARFQAWVDEQDERRAEAGERQLAGQS